MGDEKDAGPPGAYPPEGPLRGYRCPHCGSADVECTMAVYEFSALKCKGCGEEDTVDDYQIEKWFG